MKKRFPKAVRCLLIWTLAANVLLSGSASACFADEETDYEAFLEGDGEWFEEDYSKEEEEIAGDAEDVIYFEEEIPFDEANALTWEEGGIRAKAVPELSSTLPAGTVMRVIPVTESSSNYNYEGCLSLLNARKSEESEDYTGSNTVLFDLQFLQHQEDEEGNWLVLEEGETPGSLDLAADGVIYKMKEVQPEGAVDLTVSFLEMDPMTELSFTTSKGGVCAMKDTDEDSVVLLDRYEIPETIPQETLAESFDETLKESTSENPEESTFEDYEVIESIPEDVVPFDEETFSTLSESLPEEMIVYTSDETVIPEPGRESVAESTEESVPESTEESVPESTEESAAVSVEEPAPESTKESVSSSIEEPAPEPTEEPTPEPTKEPTPEPAEESEPTSSEALSESTEETDSIVPVLSESTAAEETDSIVPVLSESTAAEEEELLLWVDSLPGAMESTEELPTAEPTPTEAAPTGTPIPTAAPADGEEKSSPEVTQPVTVSAAPVKETVMDGSAEIYVNLNLVGRSIEDDDEFIFSLAADNSTAADGSSVATPMPVSSFVTVKNADALSFGSIHFTKPGTYNYLVMENVPSGATFNSEGKYEKDGVVYDSAQHKVQIRVEEAGGNKLSAQVFYDNVETGTLTFTNMYTANTPTISAREITQEPGVSETPSPAQAKTSLISGRSTAVYITLLAVGILALVALLVLLKLKN